MIQAKDDNPTCRRSCCRETASHPASHWEPRRLPTWPRKSQEERGPRSPGRELHKDDIKEDILLVRFWVGWPGLSFRWPPRGTFLPGQSPQTAATEKKTNRGQFLNMQSTSSSLRFVFKTLFTSSWGLPSAVSLIAANPVVCKKYYLWMENDLLSWFWCYW